MNLDSISQVVKSKRNRWQLQFFAKYGSWAVITGASSGIGRALAIELAKAGLDLVLVARGREALETFAKELREAHQTECRVVSADLTQEGSVETVLAQTACLDVGLLVAAAGFGTSGSFLDASLDSELDMLSVNCQSVTALVWQFGRLFRTRGQGGIILLSSILGMQGAPHAAHYAATKAYIQSLGEALFVELASQGVDVLAAAPGPVSSGFATRSNMTMNMAMTPESVAMPILRSLGRRGTVLPGFLSKLLVYSMTGLPRWVKVRIMGRVMRSMAHPG
jgi:uncharacterized protein